MEKPKKEQIEKLASHCTLHDGWVEFKCPECKTEQGVPAIENPGETKTQIHCKYGCGYIFI